MTNFSLGLNYWPRRKAMYWWKRFDRSEVEEEFAQIAEWGADLLRFFVLWEDFQPEPNRVDTRQIGNLVYVLDTARDQGLSATPTLLVGNMSGVIWLPLWAFTAGSQIGNTPQISEGRRLRRRMRSPFEDAGMLTAQCYLAQYLSNAIAGHPALHSWDLANEIDQACLPASAETGTLWAATLGDAIRREDPITPVTYGAHELSLTTQGLTVPGLARSLDYLSMHGYPMYSDVARGPLDPELVPFMTLLTSQLGRKPALMQEFGLCTAPPGRPSHWIEDDFLGVAKRQFMASEEDGGTYYAVVLDRLWQIGSLGAIAWNYADYTDDLWSKPPLDRARRERTFGLFRADGSPKPAAQVFRDFSDQLRAGTLEARLGPRGGAALDLHIDPEAYYSDPAHSFQQAYQHYLAKL